MELTDIPEEAYDGDETPPDLDEIESPEALLKDSPIRERLLDVITGLRTPTKVSEVLTVRTAIQRLPETI